MIPSRRQKYDRKKKGGDIIFTSATAQIFKIKVNEKQ